MLEKTKTGAIKAADENETEAKKLHLNEKKIKCENVRKKHEKKGKYVNTVNF